MREGLFNTACKAVVSSIVLGMLAGSALAQEPAPTPAKKPATPEEYKEFLAVDQAADPQQKSELGEQFLTKYPESEYVTRVHYYLAYAYNQLRQPPKVTEHGEKALLFQKDPTILTIMASAYADQKKIQEATATANEALEGTQVAAKPDHIAAEQWSEQMKKLAAANHFTLGRIRLGEGQAEKVAAKKKGPLTEAKASFQKAVENDPRNDLYYYYLGLSAGELGLSDETLAALAKAVVLGGPIKQYAQKDFDTFFTYYNRGVTKGKDKDREKLLAKAKADLGIQ